MSRGQASLADATYSPPYEYGCPQVALRPARVLESTRTTKGAIVQVMGLTCTGGMDCSRACFLHFGKQQVLGLTEVVRGQGQKDREYPVLVHCSCARYAAHEW